MEAVSTDADWSDQTTPSMSAPLPSAGRTKLLDLVYSPRAAELGRHAVGVESTVVIGRGAQANVCLKDDGVSRVHARIECDAFGNGRIVDSGSRNGTYVNRRRVRSASLRRGDVIRVGSSLLIYDAEDPLDVVRAAADQMAAGELPLLLTGETGSGKDMLAGRIHASGRKGPFITVNCAAMGDSIGEAELFGYVRGAFTGANSDRKGLIGSAQGGTLLLDEVAELPRAFQAKLLRVLESKKVRPLGSPHEVPIDVRFLAATNAPLSDLIRQDLFRLDLFMRFAKPVLQVPPLRERRAALFPLMKELALELALDVENRFSFETLEILLLLPWEGNVRQLKHLLVALAMAGRDQALDLPFLTKHVPGVSANLEGASGERGTVASADGSSASKTNGLIASKKPLAGPRSSRALSSIGSVAAIQLERALRSADGNVAHAADALGVSRRHLYRLLERHALDVDEFRVHNREPSRSRT